MMALLQRVSSASVEVRGKPIASIGRGLLVFVGIERKDDERTAERMAERVATYRVFADADGKMNLNVKEARGALLLAPQFTLAADTAKGTRASFTPAAAPDVASRLFDYFVSRVRLHHVPVERGRFGADMKVSLTNDGPVTFWLKV